MPRIKKTPSRQKVATVATVKRMLGRIIEKKQYPYGVTTNFTTANSGVIHSTNMTAKLAAGTSDGQRVGDTVFLVSLQFNITFITCPDENFYKYRVIVGWSGEEHNPTGFGTTGLVVADVFVNSAFDNGTMITNDKAFTVLYDNIIDINSQIIDIVDGKTIRGFIKLNQKFDYQSQGGIFGKRKNLYVCVIPQYGQGTPTNLGTMNANFVLKYNDS